MFFQGHAVAGNSSRSNPQPPQHHNSHCTPTANSGSSTGSSLGSRMSYVSVALFLGAVFMLIHPLPYLGHSCYSHCWVVMINVIYFCSSRVCLRILRLPLPNFLTH